jgi:hypothetical protein
MQLTDEHLPRQARPPDVCHFSDRSDHVHLSDRAHRVQRAEALAHSAARLCAEAAATCHWAQALVARSVRGRTRRYAVSVGRGERLVKRCAWCDRIRTSNGTWRELPSAVLEADVILSHGICADCRSRAFPQELDASPPTHDRPAYASLTGRVSTPLMVAD